jgi:hypothetical protein
MCCEIRKTNLDSFPEAFDDHSVDARLLTLIRAADPVPETKHQVFLDIGGGEVLFTFLVVCSLVLIQSLFCL